MNIATRKTRNRRLQRTSIWNLGILSTDLICIYAYIIIPCIYNFSITYIKLNLGGKTSIKVRFQWILQSFFALHQRDLDVYVKIGDFRAWFNIRACITLVKNLQLKKALASYPRLVVCEWGPWEANSAAQASVVSDNSCIFVFQVLWTCTCQNTRNILQLQKFAEMVILAS